MNTQQEKQLLDVHTQQATLTQVVTDNIAQSAKILQKHDDILLGTSKEDPGLVTRVDREEQKSKNITRLFWIVLTSVVGLGATALAAAIL